MSTHVHADRWFRVRQLRPRLNANVKIRRQRVRGETWHLLSGSVRLPSYRLNEAGWAFIGRCDGRRTVDEIWQSIVASNAEQAPTQDEIIGLLIELHDAELVDIDGRTNIAALDRRRQKRLRRLKRSRLNPLGFRAPLGNPGWLLDRLKWLAPLLFSRLGLLGWAVLVTAGLLSWVVNWDETVHHAERWLTTPRYLLIAWVCYPFIKLVHELAHGLAIRRWGGEVREWGLAILFLTPMPYVDASDGNLLPRRHQRALVSAAGIAAEMAMAAVSLIAWSQIEPGLARDVLFSIALTCGLSTVLFNANPLMRLDGYYLLCDLLHLPNLATRSSAWWQACLVRNLLGLRQRRGPALHRSEQRWLMAYTPLSWAYRMLASVWLVMWAGASHPLLGGVVALVMIVLVVLVPGYRTLWMLLRDVPSDRRRYAIRLRLATGLALIFIALPALPVPDRLMTQGVVWIAEHGRVRAQTAGFVESLVDDAQAIRRGDAIATLTAPELVTEQRRLADRRQGLVTAVYQSLLDDPFKSRQYHEDVIALDQQAALLNEQGQGLTIKANLDGQLAMTRPQDLPGRYLPQGAELGVVYTRASTIVRIALEQEDVERLTQTGQPAQVRLVSTGRTPIAGRIVHVEPAASDRLPSSALSASNGGLIVTDPSDDDRLRPLRPVRLVDIELPIDSTGLAGSRAWALLDFGYSSIASQFVRFARQQFLLHFSAIET